VIEKFQGREVLSLKRGVMHATSVPLLLYHDPVDDLWPYLRMRVPADQYAKMLQANPGLAGIFDDTKFFGSKCLAYRAY